MKRETIFKATPFFLFFLFITVPMLSLPRDMWDGTIIEYASIINDFSGLKAYFFESGWFLQYPLSIAIIEISQFLNISYKNTNALVVLVFMFVLLREALWLAEHQIKLTKPAAYFSLALIATFSTWADLLSSIMTLHFGCMAIGLFAIRSIHQKTIISTLIGFVALLTSLSIQSQLVFLPVLSYIYDLSERNKVQQSWFANPSKQTAFIFGVCIIVYLVARQLYPPHGLYENYNSLVVGSFQGLALAAFSSVAMSTYLVPVFLLVGCVSVLTLIVNNKIINSSKEESIYNPKWLAWLLVIFFAGLIPYAAVGKFSVLWGVGDWSSRQAFLLVLPTCLFTALCLQCLYDSSSSRLLKICVLVSGAVIFLFHLTLLTIAVAHKLNRQVFVSHLEQLIQDNENKLKPGRLEIVGSNIPKPELRGYEANFLMYSATGKADWWTRLGSDADTKFTIPCYIKQRGDYQIKYVYDHKTAHLDNHTIVEINTNGFRGSVNIIRNVLGISPPGVIEVIRIYSKSKEFNQEADDCN